MDIEIRISRPTLERVIVDLRRPHLFARERMGFLTSRLTAGGTDRHIILMCDYQPLAEDDYLHDGRYAAAFRGDVLRAKKQRLRDRHPSQEGAFHVHLHDHAGPTWFSGPDENGLPPIVPCLQRAAPDAATGLLVFSRDHGSAAVWLPGSSKPQPATRIVVTGAPLSIYRSYP